MDKEELFKQTVQHMGDYVEQDVSHLTPQSRLDSVVPGLDSLRIFEMMLYLEECFEVDFEESLLERIKTMGDLVDYIAEQKTAKAEA